MTRAQAVGTIADQRCFEFHALNRPLRTTHRGNDKLAAAMCDEPPIRDKLRRNVATRETEAEVDAIIHLACHGE